MDDYFATATARTEDCSCTSTHAPVSRDR
jgi:hypothetical protein